MNAHDLLPTSAVAQLLGMSEPGLRVWRQKGKGPAWVKPGGNAVFYREKDVAAWIAEHRNGDTS